MKYYAERNGLLNEHVNIPYTELKEYFFQVYCYFYNKNCFDAAIKGIWIKPKWKNAYQIVPPLFAPSPEIFFMANLKNPNIYPIYENYACYTEKELFTIIEILYDKIAVYNYEKCILEAESLRKEFAMQINNILNFYEGGYFLETSSGTIVKGTNDALKEMLSEDLSHTISRDILEQMKTAVKLYYRFDSNLEMKKTAINILADILEPLRSELKDLLNERCSINKNEHDKLIFDIVNGFNIRHNNSTQKTAYEHEIWYDWMMQYYTSVIITFYKIKKCIE